VAFSKARHSALGDGDGILVVASPFQSRNLFFISSPLLSWWSWWTIP